MVKLKTRWVKQRRFCYFSKFDGVSLEHTVWVLVSLQVVMKDRFTKQPRGFGFITFSDPAAATQACAETHTIDGRVVRTMRILLYDEQAHSLASGSGIPT